MMIKPTQQVACNYCGFYNPDPYLIKNNITIVKCKNCGLLYTSSQFTTQELVKLYGQDYFKSDNPLVMGYRDYLKERENVESEASYYLKIISEYVALKKRKLLEVGCAFGFFLNTAQKRGVDVWGIEISDFAAKIARKNFKLRVYTGRFPEIKIPQNFDIVVMWTTLEHVSDPLAYLKKTFQVLKPGGLLFLSVPDAGNFFARITGKKWPGFQKVREHNYFFTFLTLSNLLNKAGFETIEKRRAPFFCHLGFIGEKLAAYNQTLSRIIIKILKITKIFNYSLNFGLMDMFIVSRKR